MSSATSEASLPTSPLLAPGAALERVASGATWAEGRVIECSHGRRAILRDPVHRLRLRHQASPEGHPGVEEYGDRHVSRRDPVTGAVVPAVIDVEAPNGLAFSPDESLRYVADTSLAPADLERREPGRTLYITASISLYRVATTVRDAAMAPVDAERVQPAPTSLGAFPAMISGYSRAPEGARRSEGPS